jgi:hypothetical protein
MPLLALVCMRLCTASGAVGGKDLGDDCSHFCDVQRICRQRARQRSGEHIRRLYARVHTAAKLAAAPEYDSNHQLHSRECSASGTHHRSRTGSSSLLLSLSHYLWCWAGAWTGPWAQVGGYFVGDC